eukprot:12985424-Heterocapsa_arctica.AAC.1
MKVNKIKKTLIHRTITTFTSMKAIIMGKNVDKGNKRGHDNNEEDIYPGVSIQKRVKHRAEQHFHETQAHKKEQQAEAENKRARKI